MAMEAGALRKPEKEKSPFSRLTFDESFQLPDSIRKRKPRLRLRRSLSSPSETGSLRASWSKGLNPRDAQREALVGRKA
jgi:hypothetical protein